MTGDYYEQEVTLDVQASFISSNEKKNVTEWWRKFSSYKTGQ